MSKKIEAFKHVHTIGYQIVEGRLDYDDAVPLERKAGGAMVFSAMLPHQTSPKRSPHRRRIRQLQYAERIPDRFLDRNWEKYLRRQMARQSPMH